MIQTQQLRAFRTLGQWTALGAFVGVACGLASAAFLFLLELVTSFRGTHAWIVYPLPVAGLGIGAIYERWGSSIKGGNNLIIDTIHDDAPQIPLRMAPMVLIGHRAHAPVRRERGPRGDGGADGRQPRRRRSRTGFGVGRELRRQLLAAGIAGGFGSVFGTPIAGLDLRSRGRLRRAHRVRRARAGAGRRRRRRSGDARARHRAHRLPDRPGDRRAHRRSCSASGSSFGAAMALATRRVHRVDPLLKSRMERHVPAAALPDVRSAGRRSSRCGSSSGRSDYLGLGVPDHLARRSRSRTCRRIAFAAKLVFTAVTLGCRLPRRRGHAAVLHRRHARQRPRPAARASRSSWAAAVGLAAVFGAAATRPSRSPSWRSSSSAAPCSPTWSS